MDNRKRNRAKCKLCGDILESFHRHDYVECKCGEIAIDGGLDYLKAHAKDFGNFIRLDDDGNEFTAFYQEKEEAAAKVEEVPFKLDTKEDILALVNDMIESLDRLPHHAHTSSMTQLDHKAILLLFLRVLKLL
jgi:hypothetical protein